MAITATWAVGLMGAAGCQTSWPRLVPGETRLQRPITIPAEPLGRMLVVEVHINERGPYRLLLDTGSGATVLPGDLVEELDLAASPLEETRVVRSGGGYVAVDHRRARAMRIGGLELRRVDVAVHDLPKALAEPKNAPPIHGLLGLRVFNDVLLTIDLEAAELRVVPYARGLVENRARVIQARSRRGQALLVPAKLGRWDTLVMLDTAADVGLLLHPPLSGYLLWAFGPVPAGRMVTPTGQVELRRGRLAQDLRIGPHLIRRPIAVVPSQTPEVVARSPGEPLFGAPPDSVLGTELLRRFIITIDQRRNLVRLTPKEDGPITIPPIKRVWFGAVTEWRDDAVHVTDRLRPEGNLQDAVAAVGVGLVEGDRVVAIEGRPVAELDEDALRALLANLNEVTLSVLRRGRQITRTAPVVTIVP